MGKLHRQVISRIEGPVRPVFLDTPAGFELNADQIAERAIEYFDKHLGLDLGVVTFKAASAANPERIERALRQLREANYIFAGPGSPTYAIRNWRDTPILRAMAQRLANGAHLVFASAAAIAVGRHSLPVYEIYKVGEEPHWVDGLDLFEPYGFELAIVPHWNNNEGGVYDTRYCFVGQPRMRVLEQALPATAAILGVDEYTACILDLGGGEAQVMGAGKVAIRRRGERDRVYASGSVFDLRELRREGGGEGALEVPMAGEAAADWIEWPNAPKEARAVGPLVDLLVEVRAQLREAQQWALADQIRDRLADLDIVLEDGPAGTAWRER